MLQGCGKNASYPQGFPKLWKTKKVNTVNKKLTQNSRELNIYKFLTFLTQNLHLTQTLLNLNKNLINTILTQSLQDLNTGIRPTGTQSVPVGSKCPSDAYMYIGKLQAASWGKLACELASYNHARKAKALLSFR